MAHEVRERESRSQLDRVINSDGRSHPRENAFAATALVLGLIAFVTGFFPGLHLIASWVGLVGIFVAGWALMISATTGERFLSILGLGGAGVGFYMGVAHGGLWGGLLG